MAPLLRWIVGCASLVPLVASDAGVELALALDGECDGAEEGACAVSALQLRSGLASVEAPPELVAMAERPWKKQKEEKHKKVKQVAPSPGDACPTCREKCDDLENDRASMCRHYFTAEQEAASSGASARLARRLAAAAGASAPASCSTAGSERAYGAKAASAEARAGPTAPRRRKVKGPGRRPPRRRDRQAVEPGGSSTPPSPMTTRRSSLAVVRGESE
eukprot:CAMPEP_0176253812 /NCGR_PEP_ID=MMETSP0121_2-20121125/36210_1 /TAXON_ID=160619 /ORGANISM="Kryptoperidinium foliaceum, Strain CCMP 1326" /LENGTH=218 /DNA_ID=CAMNT_0017593603 /DNA_START=52 /DNA_END=707 /DNA_ORIENTATION=+